MADIDLYDENVQAGIAWTLHQVGEALGLTTWTEGDGSESVEGDVGAEIHTILVDAGLRDPETNAMATLAVQPPDGAGLTVTLVETAPALPASPSLAIRKWDNHGLPAGTHRLYTHPAPVQPDSGVVKALRHYACSCEPGHCAMSADDTDVPVDDALCGRRAAEALAAREKAPAEA